MECLTLQESYWRPKAAVECQSRQETLQTVAPAAQRGMATAPDHFFIAFIAFITTCFISFLGCCLIAGLCVRERLHAAAAAAAWAAAAAAS